MASDRITSFDVAKRAGVSQSAVSRVFTPGASFSPETARKVRQAAQDLGYRPNVLARSLITGRSRIIGLLVGHFENFFYPVAVEKFTGRLQAAGYRVLVFMAEHEVGNVEDVLEEILDYQVDGLIMAAVSLSSDVAVRCTAEGIPVVLFNRDQEHESVSSVTSDNFAGGRRVAEFLVAGGHKRFGYLAGWEEASTQRDREAGFRAGLAEAGAELAVREAGAYRFGRAQEATRRMFSGAEAPDALFVANDHMAFAAMDVIRHELGLRIPEDVSVVGYDDVPPASWAAYNLTTVRQRTNLMAEECVNILLGMIERKEAEPRRLSIKGPLVVRGSARGRMEDGQ